jgi:hypothetical protein
MFHPVWLTILAALLLWWLLARTGVWRRYYRAILLGAGVLYVIDAAVALPRIAYAWRTADRAVIHAKVELSGRLVLVNVDCEWECHLSLLSGEIDEVILVGAERWRSGVDTRTPRRVRAGWASPGTCPFETRRAVGRFADELAKDGYCPIIEPTEVPAEGIFVVRETLYRTVRELAVPLKSAYLMDAPPGNVIRLAVVEVQRRTPGRAELLAVQRTYAAPGLLGLPPMIGCWVGIDNMLGIYPPGDTGCGLWRWGTWGGDSKWFGDSTWVYRDVLTRKR